MDVRTWKKKFFSFMFFNQFNEVGITFFTVKNFSLSELNIFLQVVCGRFRDAEVLHGFRDFNPHLLAYPEIMVNRIAGSKDNCSIIQDVNLILAEILGGNSVNFKKFPEGDVDIEFSRYLTIG